MQKFRAYWLAILFSLVTTSSAWAVFDVSIAGGGTKDDLSGSAGTNSSTGNIVFGSGGVMMEYSPSKLGFELGAFYVSTSNALDPADTLTTTGTWLDFTAELRYHLASFASIGLGGYYGMPLSFSPATTYYPDFGLAADAQTRLPLGSHFGVIVDLRYLWGLGNLGPGGASRYTREILAVAGIQLSFGG